MRKDLEESRAGRGGESDTPPRHSGECAPDSDRRPPSAQVSRAKQNVRPGQQRGRHRTRVPTRGHGRARASPKRHVPAAVPGRGPGRAQVPPWHPTPPLGCSWRWSTEGWPGGGGAGAAGPSCAEQRLQLAGVQGSFLGCGLDPLARARPLLLALGDPSNHELNVLTSQAGGDRQAWSEHMASCFTGCRGETGLARQSSQGSPETL